MIRVGVRVHDSQYSFIPSQTFPAQQHPSCIVWVCAVVSRVTDCFVFLYPLPRAGRLGARQNTMPAEARLRC